MDIKLLIIATLSYLLGSVSNAILVSMLFRLPDPRVEGSGNPVATNVLRLSGKFPAVLTLAGDVAKGTVPVLAANVLTNGDPVVMASAALFAFLGHLYPLYFKFQGGKGVATALGAYLGLSLPLFAGVGMVWIVVALIFRYSSLASMTAMLSASLISWWLFNEVWLTSATGIIFLLVVFRHQANIKRLLAGKENKIQLGKS